jgi:hypothetical protein
MEKLTRRTCLFLFGALALSACRGRGPHYSTDPQNILDDLRSNPAIGSLRRGEIYFAHKNTEGVSLKGKQALAIIQRGLLTLGLIEHMNTTEFGVYGDKTACAASYLQNRARIDSQLVWEGRRFEAATLAVLETALQEKIDGRWGPPPDLRSFLKSCLDKPDI